MSFYKQLHSEFINFVRENKVLRYEETVLSSGKVSDYYLECTRISLDANGQRLANRLLLGTLLEMAKFQAIGGMELGAAPIVGGLLQCAASESFDIYDLKGFIVRKQPKGHGLKKFIEGPVSAGMKVAIVEDVTTTGQSAANAIEKAKEFGMEPVIVASLINRQEGADELFKQMGIPFVSILTKEQIG